MNNWPEMMVKRVAASYCGLSVETFEREIAAGRLPMGVHFGGRYRWRKALEDAGIEDYRFHDNRHTAATRNLRSSGNLKGVSKLLGHSNVQTTARYAHALEEAMRAVSIARSAVPGRVG